MGHLQGMNRACLPTAHTLADRALSGPGIHIPWGGRYSLCLLRQHTYKNWIDTEKISMAPAQKKVMVLHGGLRHVNFRKTGLQAFCATNVQRKQTCVVSAPEAHGYLNILPNYLQRHI